MNLKKLAKSIKPEHTYTVIELSELLEIERRNITNLVKEKKLKAWHTGKERKHYRILGKSVIDFFGIAYGGPEIWRGVDLSKSYNDKGEEV